MALRIIGSGFGRTGTMSARLALDQLGFGPCHHMLAVMEDPAQPAFWKALSRGETVDWTEVFKDYTAQVDWPGAKVWEETLTAFPDAVVLHTERPEEKWWASFQSTIGKFFARRAELDLPPDLASIFEIMAGWLIEETFADHTDRECALAAYRRNNARVRELVRPDRLLVYDVAQGWGPLCEFLQVPVPETSFPRANPREEFWAHFGGEPLD